MILIFSEADLRIRRSRDRIGSVYTKAIYKQYTDSNFIHEIPKPAWQGKVFEISKPYARQFRIHEIPKPAWECKSKRRNSQNNYPPAWQGKVHEIPKPYALQGRINDLLNPGWKGNIQATCLAREGPRNIKDVCLVK